MFGTCLNSKVKVVQPAANATAINENEVLPQVFWSTEQGKPGREHVVFTTLDKTFLICKDGKLTVDAKEFSRDSLFTVIMFDATHIALKSINGGYLTYKDKKFICSEKKIDEKNSKFEIDRKLENLKISNPNYDIRRAVALKIDNHYLGYENLMVVPIKELNEKSVFMAPHKVEDVSNLPAGANKIVKFDANMTR